MAKIRVQIGYSPVTKHDIRNVLYIVSVIWLFSTKDIGSQTFGFLLILAYPILRLNDRSKKKQGLDVEKDFPTFRKWNENIRKGLSSIKNKILDIKSRVQH